MIYTPEVEPITWNVGRPDIFNEEDRQFWKFFHDQVKNSEIPVAINGLWNFFENMLNSEEFQGYGGGGMKYVFGFKTQEDLDKFKKIIERRILDERLAKAQNEQKGI